MRSPEGDLPDDVSFIHGGALRSPLMSIDHRRVVESHEPQEGGVEVVDVDAFLDGVKAKIIGGPDGLATAHTAAREPQGEAGGVVVASVPLLGHGGATELPAPDHERVVEEAAGLEVGEKPGDGLVLAGAEFRVVLFDASVGIPAVARAVVDLDEADIAFHETSGEEAQTSHGGGFRPIDAVQAPGSFGFTAEICLLYTSPSPRDRQKSRMPSSA